ncbi:MAG: glycosidase [Gammaproteobacteria bacterium]|jgi:glycosidase
MPSFVRVTIFSGLLLGITIILYACQPQTSMQTNTNNCELDFSCAKELLLHVASPKWQDQIIYFLMIDRFADGDSSNNDQGVGVFDPSKESHYSGGDLRGIIERIEYIKNLGATTVWTTPQVANQWWDPLVNYSGYHGYWARDFKSVDEHYGSLLDYQQLSSALHKKGMYLIQDVVVNHTGNFFSYQGGYDPDDPTKNIVLNSESQPSSSPTQFPFNQNDVTNPEHRAANIFNWTPSIQDFSIPVQETTYQTADLDDLNTLNPLVRKALKESFGFWIKKAGVDGIRIDTAKYVEKEFYEDFLHAADGLEAIAKQTGKDQFLSFGEIYQTSEPFSDNGERKLSEYVSDDQIKRMSAAIGFPLYKEISRVFAGGAPTAYMSYRLQAQMENFDNPFLIANFIDNHDVERFLAAGNINGFKQAYALMMTVPGIPIIYQGDEQSFRHSRQAMFAGGYLSSQDQFNQQSSMYQFIQKLADIRKTHKVFSRGNLQVLKDNAAGPGVLVYKRNYKTPDGEQVAYVIFNTAKQDILLNNLQTDFTSTNPGQILASQFLTEELVFDQQGLLTSVLPAQSFVIVIGEVKGTSIGIPNHTVSVAAIEITDIKQQYINLSQAKISGVSALINTELLRVIDGKLGDAKVFKTDTQGNWNIDLPVTDYGQHQHSVEIFSPANNRVSKAYYYKTSSSQIDYSATQKDPLGDDTGPTGKYIKPLDSSVGCQMDIRQVNARAGGAVLKLDIQMCDVSTLWAPPNGFDHVSFNIFFDLKGKQGQRGNRALPFLNAEFPSQQRWDLAHMAFGWGNYLYWSDAASVNSEGTKPGISPKIEVNTLTNSISFTYDGNQLGINDWQETTLYITTWDKSGEGNYRDLQLTSDNWRFSGAVSSAPKILDDLIINLAAHPQ